MGLTLATIAGLAAKGAGALLSSAPGVVGTLLNANRADRNREFQKNAFLYSTILNMQKSASEQSNADRSYNFQREQFEYQKGLNQTLMNREDTQYQRTVKDMQAAGINPIIMNGASTNVLSSGSYSGSSTSGGSYSGSVNLDQADFSGLGRASQDVAQSVGLYDQLLNSKNSRDNNDKMTGIAQSNSDTAKVSAETSSKAQALEERKYNENKAGNTAAQAATTRSSNASAHAQELRNQANQKLLDKIGLTVDQLSNMDWQTAASILGIINSDKTLNIFKNREVPVTSETVTPQKIEQPQTKSEKSVSQEFYRWLNAGGYNDTPITKDQYENLKDPKLKKKIYDAWYAKAKGNLME